MVGKRKVNSHTFCIDPKKKINSPKKQQTKADILQELKTVQKINEALEEEIKVDIEKIKVLEVRVIFLEKQNNSSARGNILMNLGTGILL